MASPASAQNPSGSRAHRAYTSFWVLCVALRLGVAQSTQNEVYARWARDPEGFWVLCVALRLGVARMSRSYVRVELRGLEPLTSWVRPTHARHAEPQRHAE